MLCLDLEKRKKCNLYFPKTYTKTFAFSEMNVRSEK